MTRIINNYLFDGSLSDSQMNVLNKKFEKVMEATMVVSVFALGMSAIWLIGIFKGLA